MLLPCHPLPGERAVWLEVPKAGCTSLKVALADFRKGDPPKNADEVHTWFGYSHVETLKGFDQRWRGWYRFTVVRSPITRFLSFFYGLNDDERPEDLNEFVLHGFEHNDWRYNIHAAAQ